MVSPRNKNQIGSLANQSSLMSLQPVDNAPFKDASSAWLVWLSLILVAMASLLPWRQWQPVPDVLCILLVFWSFHEPSKVGLFTAFIFGLLIDVHDVNLLGQNALYYLLCVYGVSLMRRRLFHFNAIIQMLHILPVIIISALLVNLLVAWQHDQWLGFDWLWSAIITCVLWPFIDIIMFLHQRRSVADDVGSV